jgi:hypothetical protein
VSITSEEARAALSAAADRKARAEREHRAAWDELKAARAGYRTARQTYDDTVAAEEFDRTHPALFGAEDVSGVIGAGGLICSDADPGL